MYTWKTDCSNENYNNKIMLIIGMRKVYIKIVRVGMEADCPW
jgi:hypothetical protein